MPLAPGTRLGPYEILALLGAGGMGEVYRTRDTKLNRDVALKILPEAFTDDAERVARFRREAHMLATLNHPHIGAIYGLDEANGNQFLVLELVDGESLEKRIARGRIPVDEVLEIARQIGEALEAAHDKGIIHRDLKPANIALTKEGEVKVLDFGLAKPAATGAAGATGAVRAVESPTITTPVMLTGVGLILGTAAYISPEQAKGWEADQRSDVWAFGCVLYEMISGRCAFDGEDVRETLAAVLRGQPDWTMLPAGVPPAIRLLLTRCLEKDRKKRIGDISTALFLMNELTAAGPATVTVQPMTAAWRRVVPFVATALVAGGIVASVAWFLGSSSAAPVVSRFTVPLPEGQAFTNDGRHVVAISPDGTQMVYVANGRLHRRTMANLESTPILGAEARQGVLNPVFSPDGQSIAFWVADDRAIKRMAVNGGAAVTVCSAQRPTGITWDARGILFGQGGEGIMRVAAAGGEPETLVRVNEGEIAHGPQMLPDGRHVLFTVATGTSADRWDKAKVVLQSLDSGDRKTLIDGGSDGRVLPTGHIVYALGGTLLAVPFDLRRLEVRGGPVPILEGVRRGNTPEMNPGVAHFSVSSTGALIYVPGPLSPTAADRELVRVDLKGGIQPLKLPRGRYETPRVSPDGRYLAFGTEEAREAIVWIYDLSGTSSVRRLTVGGRNRYPIWSADGKRVAFQSDREGDLGIFWQRADGTGPAERLTTPEPRTSHLPESWSPTGDRFLFSSVTTGGAGASLWTYSLQDRKVEPFGGVRLSVAILPCAVFSPNGRWVAYLSDETGVTSVYVQPFPATGAKYLISKGRAISPLWSPDGKSIVYAENTAVTADPRTGGLVVVSLTTEPTLTFGNPVVVPSGGLQTGGLSAPNAPRRFDMAPDGTIIGIVEADQSSPQSGALRIEVVLNWLEELKALVPSR
jgi:eukaryotic-like serine/threonine-protein kinase